MTVALFILLFWLLDLSWLAVLVLYACFSFNWSTRQYVGHAFSRRDVIDGAWNLSHNRVMSGVLLHGEWDLNHHRHPEVSWYYLPHLSAADEPRVNYHWQYWRQWVWLRPNTEASPESLQPMSPEHPRAVSRPREPFLAWPGWRLVVFALALGTRKRCGGC